MEKDAHGQSLYRSKTRSLQELKYLGNYKVIADKLIEWGKAKPDNKVIKTLGQAFAEIGIYVTMMQQEQDTFERIVSQYRSDKLQYQKQALEAAQKLAQYEEKYFGKGEQ